MIGAEVVASVEASNQRLLVELRDDGISGDITKDDGTYTGLLLNTDEMGKHSVSVIVENSNETQIKSTILSGKSPRLPGKETFIFD